MHRIQKTIRDVLTPAAPPPPSVGIQASVSDAIAVMRRDRAHSVLVVEGAQLAGIFTERDLLNRVIGEGHDPQTTPVAQVMSRQPTTLWEGACITYAINRMGLDGFSNMPILNDDGRPVALLDVRDVMEHLTELFAQLEEPDIALSESDWVDIGGG